MGPPFAFEDIRTFDGVAMADHQTVVVDGARISRVGPAAGPPAPCGSTVIDGAGRTLLPGFIDTHVHLGLLDPKTVLRGAVTTARDLAWPPERVFPLAARLAGDAASGPRLLAAGPMITAPLGYPTRAGWAPPGTGMPVASTGQARAAVRSLAEAGSAVIKVAQEPRSGPTLPPEVLRAVVEEAHAAGLKVTSHLGSLAELQIALDAGVDELAHGLWSDEEIPDALIHRMVAQGMVVVPTLHIHPSPTRLRNLGRFVDARGRVVYGTDMGNLGPPPGVDPEELALMVGAGMTPLRALSAATSDAARHLALPGGRIVPGALADLLLVKGNPLEDLSTLARPVLVMREGRVAG